MSEIVASGIIEADRLEAFAETFASKPPGDKRPLVSEIKLHMSDSGFHATAVDPANVAMIESADLHARGFEAYESPGSATVGVNLETLLDRIGEADSGQLVQFELDMETRRLNIEYGSASLSMALIDPQNIRDEPDPAEIDLPNEVVLEGEQFDHAVTISEMLSDHLFIEGRPDDRQVVFYSEGDKDTGSVEFGDDDVIDAKVNEAAESVFSVSYLRSFVKPIPDDAEVTVRFGNEYPVRVMWETFDGAFEVMQTLAPRIQST